MLSGIYLIFLISSLIFMAFSLLFLFLGLYVSCAVCRVKITALWYITPCSLDVDRRFRGAYCLVGAMTVFWDIAPSSLVYGGRNLW
jgi:hypothetical protein